MIFRIPALLSSLLILFLIASPSVSLAQQKAVTQKDLGLQQEVFPTVLFTRKIVSATEQTIVLQP